MIEIVASRNNPNPYTVGTTDRYAFWYIPHTYRYKKKVGMYYLMHQTELRINNHEIPTSSFII